MKRKIGIVPAADIGDTEKSCMEDFYKIGNNYTKRVLDAGCMPIGLAPVDNLVCEEALDICDGFLVQGGAVEGTEYSDHVLCVQGHPEADGTLPELFKFLC